MIDRSLPAVLIAEAPPPAGCGPRGALDGDSGLRLARACWSDAPADDAMTRLLRGLERRNLLDAPGAGVNADARAWPSREAQRAAIDLWLSPELSRGPLQGRVVLLAGRRVLRAFSKAVGIPGTLPPLSRLQHAGTEWVALPHPSGRCRWWNDDLLRRRAGEVVRAEVERAEAARRSWCTLGHDVLRGRPGALPGEVFAFDPSSGRLLWLPEASDAGREHAVDVLGAVLDVRQLALAALCRNLGRVLRWGGGSECSVLAHSIRVAWLAGVASGGVSQEACSRLGAAHDLHEGLPGVGDVPGPAIRWLRAASPEVAELHRRAEELVLALAGIVPGQGLGAWEIMRWADHAALAVERAAYFGDAPPWLGRARPIAEAMRLDEPLCRHVRLLDQRATPEELLGLVHHGIHEKEFTSIPDHLRLAARVLGLGGP